MDRKVPPERKVEPVSLEDLAAAAQRRDDAAKTTDKHAAHVRQLALTLVAHGTEIAHTARIARVTRATLYKWIKTDKQN